MEDTNELSVYGGGGVPVLLSKGVSSSGFSGEAGLGFTAFVNEQVAVHFGVGFGLSNVTIKAKNLKTLTPALIDDHGYLYNLHTTLSGYSEAQKATFFSIPVMLLFQSKPETQGYYAKRMHNFYAMGGAKLLFRYQTEYKSSVATLNNTAYYSEFDNKAATQTFAGLGTFKGNSTAGSFNSGLSMMLALEMGIKWYMSENAFLYTGAYLDYGLNDPAKNQRQPLNNYTAAEHLSNLTLLAFEDKVRLITVGIKLRLAFSRSATQQTWQTPKRKKKRVMGCPY